jgi:NAD(P)H dehydrogenase (quinone)
MTKKVYVIIYSTWGHLKQLADEVVRGLKESGVEATLYQVSETLPKEVTTKMHAATFDIPIIQASDLVNADAFIFGLPTRFGCPPAQIKQFWDSTGQLWFSQALRGKYAATFFSTANLGGGQESTALTFLPNLVHHGIIYVPLGNHAVISDISEVHGGSFYGAGTIAAADGSRQPSAKEKELAYYQGTSFAGVLKRVD